MCLKWSLERANCLPWSYVHRLLVPSLMISQQSTFGRRAAAVSFVFVVFVWQTIMLFHIITYYCRTESAKPVVKGDDNDSELSQDTAVHHSTSSHLIRTTVNEYHYRVPLTGLRFLHVTSLNSLWSISSRVVQKKRDTHGRRFTHSTFFRSTLYIGLRVVTRTLQHLRRQSIRSCWNRTMEQSSIAPERGGLILYQLYFASWQHSRKYIY